jgi:hypothetical protein
MTLRTVDLDELFQEDFNRGVNAAQDYFDKNLINPDNVYSHNILTEAEGKDHFAGFLGLWGESGIYRCRSGISGQRI